jgi:hypothetical protein
MLWLYELTILSIWLMLVAAALYLNRRILLAVYMVYALSTLALLVTQSHTWSGGIASAYWIGLVICGLFTARLWFGKVGNDWPTPKQNLVVLGVAAVLMLLRVSAVVPGWLEGSIMTLVVAWWVLYKPIAK